MKRTALVLAAAAALLSTFVAPAFAQRTGAPPAGTSAAGGGGRGPGSEGPTSSDQSAPSTTSSTPPKIDKAAIARGMKEAPAIQQATGQPCEITSAAYRGDGSQKGPDGKTRQVTSYETACASGLGYLLVAPKGGAPQAFDCMAAQGTPTACALPENLDPKAGLSKLVTAGGATCAVSDGRYIGNGKENQTFYEVACGAQPGYLVIKPVSGTPQLQPCAATLDTPNGALACKFTTKAQIVTYLQPVVQQSGKTCQVSDVRYLGVGAATGETFYEFGCGAAPGFVAVLDKAGKYKQAVDCSRAQGIAGGCKFTDAAQSAAAQNAVYADAVAKAGYDCKVSKARLIGADNAGRDVVELACSNRPDGAIAVLAKAGGASSFIDCGRAGYLGGATCQLSPASATYPRYTAALSSKVKNACTVSNTVYAGSGAGEQFVETACADGRRGYVVGFNGPGFDVKEVLTCSQAKFQGLSCKLPGDTFAK